MSDQIASPVLPDLRTLLYSERQATAYALNCHEVGKITAFDSVKQTASVQIQVLRNLSGRSVPYPLLTDCPVHFPQGGGFSLTFPVAVGDPCLVLFNDRDLDNWFATGAVQLPNSGRAHDLSDGMVLVGFRNLSNPIATFSATSVELRNAAGTVKVQIQPNGTLQLLSGGSIIGIASNGTVSLLGPTSGTVFIGTDGKVKISKGGADFGDALDLLFAALLAWVNTGGSTPNATTLTSLTTAKTAVDAVIA